MYYSVDIFFINLYLMTINNKWLCREKIIYNQVRPEVEMVGNYLPRP
jgi:hypothetical protein